MRERLGAAGWILGVWLALGWVPTVSADVVDAPPLLCLPGTTAYTSHGGPGCRPDPPDDCPEGYVALVKNDVAYCDPPHATACPTGSFESSDGPNQPSCWWGMPCEGDDDCRAGVTCRPARLCMDENAGPYRDPRFFDYHAYGDCETDADCDPGQVCDSSPRCDPDVHRVDPQGRTLEAIVPSVFSRPWVRIALGCGFVPPVILLAAAALWWRRRRARGERARSG